MVFDKLFGRSFVDTKYSVAEVVRRLHTCTEYLNRLAREHASNTNPVQRAAILGRMLFQMFRFQILGKKLVAAYLKLQASDIDNASAYFLRTPQQQQVIDGTYEQIKKNLRGVVEEQSRERGKAHYLRRFARDIINRARASRKDVQAKIAAARRHVQRQQKQAQKPQGKLKPPFGIK